MKKTEVLLSIIDEFKKIVHILNDLIDSGNDLINKIKSWIQRTTTFIKEGFNSIMETIGGGHQRKDLLEFIEDDLFV